MSLGQPGLYGKYQADESYLDLSQNTREEERGKEGARVGGRERMRMRESGLSCSPNSPFLVCSSESWPPDLSLCPTTSAGSKAASVTSALVVSHEPQSSRTQVALQSTSAHTAPAPPWLSQISSFLSPTSLSQHRPFLRSLNAVIFCEDLCWSDIVRNRQL